MAHSAEAPVSPAGNGASLLRLENIHVTFGGTVALVDEFFHVMPGEIVGLLGHNGAGKSTLVNVASGAIRPQRGRMFLGGEAIPLRGEPGHIERLGIKVIHQQPALADNLSVADNITLGRPEEKRPRSERRRFAVSALSLLGSSMNVDRPVSSLAFGEKQIVDLARALSTSLRVLFLDEPTGALGQHEADRLHELLRNLAADILKVCTRLVVLRSGRVVLDRPRTEFGLADLSAALAPEMSGKEKTPAEGKRIGHELLTVDWYAQRLAFRRGEITGLFGMAAGPQFKLLQSLFGIGEPIAAGLEGERFAPGSPREAMRRGVYYVSADREGDGLLIDMSALDNLVLPWIGRHTLFGVYSHSKAASVYERAKLALNIQGGHLNAPVGALSGGNRQKVVVGRWLFGDQPKVLLLSQPTQGVDVGARADIARALRRLAAEGVTVLVASSESDEIELLCDRAYICEGESWMEAGQGPDWGERLLEGLVAQVRR